MPGWELRGYRERQCAATAVLQKVKIWSSDAGIDLGFDVWMGQERLDLRTEHQLAIHRRVEQGPDAHPVAGQEELRSLRVPDGNGELAIQMVQAAGAMLLVQVQDDFGVGIGREAVAAASSSAAQLHVVVDLAVEHDPQRSVLVADRLLPACSGR